MNFKDVMVEFANSPPKAEDVPDEAIERLARALLRAYGKWQDEQLKKEKE